MQTKQSFYITNYTCLQARGMWELAYINEKESLVFIFNVSTLKFIEIVPGSIKLESSMWKKFKYSSSLVIYFDLNINGFLLLFPERRRWGERRDHEGPGHLARGRLSWRAEKGIGRGCWGPADKSPTCYFFHGLFIDTGHGYCCRSFVTGGEGKGGVKGRSLNLMNHFPSMDLRPWL